MAWRGRHRVRGSGDGRGGAEVSCLQRKTQRRGAGCASCRARVSKIHQKCSPKLSLLWISRPRILCKARPPGQSLLRWWEACCTSSRLAMKTFSLSCSSRVVTFSTSRALCKRCRSPLGVSSPSPKSARMVSVARSSSSATDPAVTSISSSSALQLCKTCCVRLVPTSLLRSAVSPLATASCSSAIRLAGSIGSDTFAPIGAEQSAQS